MHERDRPRARLRRFVVTMVLAFAAIGGLSVGWSWANPPEPPAQSPPPGGAPAQPPADAQTPAPPAGPQAPRGEPFVPPDASVDAPVAPPAPPAAPSSPSPAGVDTSPATSTGSSTSGTERAVGAGIAVAGVGAAAAGGLLGRRPDETKDDYTRRMAGTGIWSVAGAAILIAKGVTLASGLAGGACLVVAFAIWRWGAPGRTRAEPAPQGPPLDMQQSLTAVQDRNLELNRAGVKTQSQTAPNPVADP